MLICWRVQVVGVAAARCVGIVLACWCPCAVPRLQQSRCCRRCLLLDLRYCDRYMMPPEGNAHCHLGRFLLSRAARGCSFAAFQALKHYSGCLSQSARHTLASMLELQAHLYWSRSCSHSVKQVTDGRLNELVWDVRCYLAYKQLREL